MPTLSGPVLLGPPNKFCWSPQCSEQSRSGAGRVQSQAQHGAASVAGSFSSCSSSCCCFIRERQEKQPPASDGGGTGGRGRMSRRPMKLHCCCVWLCPLAPVPMLCMCLHPPPQSSVHIGAYTGGCMCVRPMSIARRGNLLPHQPQAVEGWWVWLHG